MNFFKLRKKYFCIIIQLFVLLVKTLNNLTVQEKKEINEYINIYKNLNFSKHYEVNNYISRNQLWGRFPTIRSRNTHANGAVVPGIFPKYYAIVCELVGMESGDGTSLEKSEEY